MDNIYKKRRANLATWMAQQGIGAIVLQDTEERRTPGIRYFTGHPGDAIFILAVDGSSVLCPWDEIMAEKMAHVDKIVPYTTFERQVVRAVSGLLEQLKVPEGSRVEIPSSIPYPLFLHFVDEMVGYNVVCREEGVDDFIDAMRSIKDSYEIDCIRKASAITDTLVDMIEAGVRDGTIQTEADVALLIEKECRKAGCEGTGFDTLAAGPARSFGIHCFPPYTAGEWPGQGLSILDFGVVYQGYTSDVTLTVAKGPLTEAQEKQIELVEKAYEAALPFYQKGVSVKTAASKADEVFSKAKRSMPHSLGHGYGLEAHEFPIIRSRSDEKIVFMPGMVVTLEPGLYDPEIGGCRLENDVLITENGNEVLTHSRIIRL